MKAMAPTDSAAYDYHGYVAPTLLRLQERQNIWNLWRSDMSRAGEDQGPEIPFMYFKFSYALGT